MESEGPLKKMSAHYEKGKAVQYRLPIGEKEIPMNELIGHPIQLHYKGKITCFCGKEKTRVYRQNFCYPCYYSLPEASECIFKPELCQGHLGEGRDPEWEQAHHVQPHYVYLALSSDLKVGVTRADQIPTRWIDQGASQAIRIADTPNRNIAGRIEVELKQKMKDKTNWRKMILKEFPSDIDLYEEKKKAYEHLSPEMKSYFLEEDEITNIQYPDQYLIPKVKSLNLEKTPEIHGTLAGIRGQYLVFQSGEVINVRKFTGFQVNMRFMVDD